MIKLPVRFLALGLSWFDLRGKILVPFEEIHSSEK